MLRSSPARGESFENGYVRGTGTPQCGRHGYSALWQSRGYLGSSILRMGYAGEARWSVGVSQTFSVVQYRK